MKKERKTFSQKFKQEAVALVVEQGYSCAEAGRSLGVNGTLIGRWKRQLEDDRSEAFPGKGKRTAEQQRLHKLETENRQRKHSAIGYRIPMQFDPVPEVAGEDQTSPIVMASLFAPNS